MIKDHWTGELPKRFYKGAEVAPEGDGYTVLLDGRAVRTPLRRRFQVPSKSLAEAIAAEWSDQDERIDPISMPVTKLANTSIDHSTDKADAIIDEFISYADSDLLCYRAESPEELVGRQTLHWDPVLAWAREHLGARFALTAGVVHVPQPIEALQALRTQAGRYDPFRLTGLQTITALTGSAVLALAVAEGTVAPEPAWTAAFVDEDWQIELWGRDAEAERQRASRRNEFDAATRFLGLLAG